MGTGEKLLRGHATSLSALSPTILRHFPFLDEAAVHPLLFRFRVLARLYFLFSLSLTFGTYLLLSGQRLLVTHISTLLTITDGLYFFFVSLGSLDHALPHCTT
jgi:hypothetical protein